MVFFLLGSVLYWAISLYLTVMVVRMILDWVQFFAPQWRPSGIVLVAANVIYALTDPPLMFLRKKIPALRLGNGLSLDVGFMVLFIGLIVARRIAIMILSLGL
ncbi:YggT family protein [Schaalia sp. Marseille-Q2122]|uniref:YggT family protein n=1 Tax=Schaalia sp. Marseille-Q2122 TaxID=2736604 RepID=UPI0026DCD535|nr:YggT family protein [Schaalia sp. Marseille-Q2122]